jgi:hypothetical protein
LNIETRAGPHVETEVYNTACIEPVVATLDCCTIAFSGTALYLLPHVRSRIAASFKGFGGQSVYPALGAGSAALESAWRLSFWCFLTADFKVLRPMVAFRVRLPTASRPTRSTKAS